MTSKTRDKRPTLVRMQILVTKDMHTVLQQLAARLKMGPSDLVASIVGDTLRRNFEAAQSTLEGTGTEPSK